MSDAYEPAGVTRFVVCGEALIDLVPHGPVLTESDSTQLGSGQLGSGQSGPGRSERTSDLDSVGGANFASDWQAQSAGGPLNTAIALARLDRRVEFCGPLSDDAFGRQIAAHLSAHAVSIDHAAVSSAPTSVAVLSLDTEGKASYAFHTADTATFEFDLQQLPQLAATDWLHVASLALVVSPGSAVLRQWVGRHTGSMSLDVNVRPAVISDPAEYWQRIEPWLTLVLSRSGVIKGSDEDFEFLARGAQVGSIDELVRGLLARSSQGCVVMTEGPRGARALLAGSDEITVAGFSSTVVDTVGAGDTFTAGFLDVYAEPSRPDRDPADHLRAALRRGVAASALVVRRRGAQPPTAREVDELLS